MATHWQTNLGEDDPNHGRPINCITKHSRGIYLEATKVYHKLQLDDNGSGARITCVARKSFSFVDSYGDRLKSRAHGNGEATRIPEEADALIDVLVNLVSELDISEQDLLHQMQQKLAATHTNRRRRRPHSTI